MRPGSWTRKKSTGSEENSRRFAYYYTHTIQLKLKAKEILRLRRLETGLRLSRGNEKERHQGRSSLLTRMRFGETHSEDDADDQEDVLVELSVSAAVRAYYVSSLLSFGSIPLV